MAEQRIDAVKMTRSIRDRNYERLRHLSRAERLAFYREQARLMNAKALTLVKLEKSTPEQVE
ncbi:MAG: hypothetical protein KF893_03780 [Caldilineaceae bacterium]|nr:hypothetical protein [Caldilineaceae bacterium]